SNYGRSVWTMPYLGHYAPVHNTALALLYHFFKLAPLGYHVAQVLIHAGCVCLVYFIVRELESARVALVAAALFALHPTNIETVAWISETKSTLSFFFFLLAFWFYVRFRQSDRTIDSVLVGVFLLLSILSKITTIVAPAIFLLYDWRQGTPLRSLRWKSLATFFLISAVFTAVHIFSFHGSTENLERSYGGGLLAHWQNFPFLIWFYVRMS